jgi:hypothetical protein
MHGPAEFACLAIASSDICLLDEFLSLRQGIHLAFTSIQLRIVFYRVPWSDFVSNLLVVDSASIYLIEIKPARRDETHS